MRMVEARDDLVIIELKNGVILGVHEPASINPHVEFQFVNADNLVARHVLSGKSFEFRNMLDVDYTRRKDDDI